MKLIYKSIFSILILTTISCQVIEIQSDSHSAHESFSIEMAKENYQKVITESNRFRKSGGKSEKTNLRKLQWNQAYFLKTKNEKKLVVPFSLDSEIYMVQKDSTVIPYSKTTWFVVVMRQGRMGFELITKIPDKEFLVNPTQKFTGVIVVENLFGDFIKGYQVGSRKVKKLINKANNLRTTVSYECDLVDWYSCASVNGIGYGCSYNYTSSYCTELEDDEEKNDFFAPGNEHYDEVGNNVVHSGSGYQLVPNDPGNSYYLQNFNDPIDLEKFFNCFRQVSSEGATYQAKLCIDIPQNDNIDALMVYGRPGHTFLTLTKSSGPNSITQSIGFYPKKGEKSVTHIAVNAQMVDDGLSEHEYNAYMEINIQNEIDFNAILNLAKNYATSMHYDLDDFNCTDFAVDVINNGVSASDQIHVSDWIGSVTAINYGTTPNGLYKYLLQRRNQSNSPIYFGNWNAPKSHGNCN